MGDWLTIFLPEIECEQSRLVFKGSVGSRRQSLMVLVKDRYYIPSYFARRLLFSGLCLSVQLIYRGDMGEAQSCAAEENAEAKRET